MNGRDYSSNNITLDKDYSSVSVVIYDKALNSKSINCSMKEDIVKLTPKFELLSISPSGGETMKYWLNIPEGAHENGAVLLFLHGTGETKKPDRVKNLPQVQFPDKYKGDKYILVAPVGNKEYFLERSAKNTLKALLESIIKEYKVDRNKVYIAGFSGGTVGAWGLANDNPGYFKGALMVSCCGGFRASNFKDTKVLAISGTEGDERYYVNCMQENVDSVLAAGGVAKKITLDGYDHGEVQQKMNYQEALDWLFS